VTGNLGHEPVDLCGSFRSSSPGAVRVDSRAQVAEHDVTLPLGLRLVELDLAVARRILRLLRQLGRLRLDLVHQSHV
jgi:hypothetical protein